jgi:hypothetical protein
MGDDLSLLFVYTGSRIELTAQYNKKEAYREKHGKTH